MTVPIGVLLILQKPPRISTKKKTPIIHIAKPSLRERTPTCTRKATHDGDETENATDVRNTHTESHSQADRTDNRVKVPLRLTGAVEGD